MAAKGKTNEPVIHGCFHNEARNLNNLNWRIYTVQSSLSSLMAS